MSSALALSKAPLPPFFCSERGGLTGAGGAVQPALYVMPKWKHASESVIHPPYPRKPPHTELPWFSVLRQLES